MEYTTIQRLPDAFQQSITREQLIAICHHAFGKHIQINSAQELSGGLYNNTYLIHINAMLPVILRVAPHPTRQFASDTIRMRNEYAAFPFFAPIAPLLPKILMADFTHQLIERDYMLQTCMEGEQWAQILPTFTPQEQKSLWHQLGTITKQIHSVQGDLFGNVLLTSTFPSWSLTITNQLTTIIHNLAALQLDTSDIRSILASAQAHHALLDEITQPHLLHGDLWTVNILVKRKESGPQITAILDFDGASWGDPLSDWTIFLLHLHANTEIDAFWQTYGQPENNPAAQFRNLIYRGRYLGEIRLEKHRLHLHDAVKRSYRDMQILISHLEDLN